MIKHLFLVHAHKQNLNPIIVIHYYFFSFGEEGEGGFFIDLFFLSLLIFSVAFRFIAIFVAHFIVFLSREILAGQISS